MLDLELKDLLVNVSELVNDVAQNLSIPVSSLNALLSAKINFTEVCHCYVACAMINFTEVRHCYVVCAIVCQ